jgi:hypothetical protein
MKKTLLSLVAILAFAGLANAQVPARAGWWKFDDADALFKATIGASLVPTDETSNYAVDGPDVGNGAIANVRGQALTMEHGLAGNGGGTRLNEYTMQWDVMISDLVLYHCLIQNGPMDEGDGDLFIKPASGVIGTSFTTYSTSAIAANQWYRIVISVKCGEFYRIYVDGVKWLEGDVPNIDSRFSLNVAPNIFGDDDTENDLIYCADLCLWDVALTDDQVSQLGDVHTFQEGLRDNKSVANTADLMPNYPNPVAHNTVFPYQVLKTGNVSFRVLDQTGKVIDVINAGSKTPGQYKLDYNSDKLAKGIYSVQMVANNRTSVRKMVVIR